MKMRSTLIAGVLSASALLATSRAQAAVSFSYVAGATSYAGTAGSTVAVPIYVKQTLTNGSPSFITAEGGLSAAGAAVSFVSSTGGSTSTLASTSFTPATPFSAAGSNSYVPSTNSSKPGLEFALLNQTTTAADPTNNLVEIGTLNLVVGSGVTTFAVSSINNDTVPGGADGTFGTASGDGSTTTTLPATVGFDLDATDQSAYTGADAAPAFDFTVSPTASPEPTSLSLLGLGTAALLRRRRLA